jgi:RNA polymerase sigma-70 factor, ECF subfamily
VGKEDLSAGINLDALSREEALICLMRIYAEEIKRLAFTFVKNWPQAEDLTQDVFVTLYTKLATFRGDAAIRSGIYMIAINKSKDYLKSWNYRKIQLTDKLNAESISENDAVEDHVISNTEDRALYQVVLQLPLKYREVILLHYYREFSVRETSEFLSLKEATVKTRLSRARKLLNYHFVELGGEQ